MADARPDADTSKRAETMANDWFSLHAGQRMQLVQFFLLGASFLTAGYAAALNGDRPFVATGIAVGGALVSFYFWRLDVRTRELVRKGEAALQVVQSRLSEIVEVDELRLVEAADQRSQPFYSYGEVLRALYWTACLGFIVGAVVPIWTEISRGSSDAPAGASISSVGRVCRDHQGEVLLVVGAKDSEVQPFVELLADQMGSRTKLVSTATGRVIDYGELRDTLVLVASSGRGKVNSGTLVQQIADDCEVAAVFRIGIAGGISLDGRQEVNVGDVVIPLRSTFHDWRRVIDIRERFTVDTDWSGRYDKQYPEFVSDVPLVANGKRCFERPYWFVVDADLLDVAREAAMPRALTVEIASGSVHRPDAWSTLVSGDQFVGSKVEATALHGEYGAVVVEMEAASIAYTACLNQIPHLIVQSVSDVIGGEKKGDASTATAEAASAEAAFAIAIQYASKN